MTRTILLALLFVAPLTGVCRPKKAVHIRSFKKVVAAVNRAKTFQVSWSNGDVMAWTMVSCPDKAATTTFDDVAQRTAWVLIRAESWQSIQGNSGPWVKRTNTEPQILCGRSGLVFPAKLDLKTASRGKLITNARGSCEEWIVRTKQKDSPVTYVYCVGRDNLPVERITEGDSFNLPDSDLFKYVTFSHWNTPVNIEPPKDGEPPCCPPMR